MQKLKTIFSLVWLPVLVVAGGVGGFLLMGNQPAVGTQDDAGETAPLVEVVTTQKHEHGLEFDVDGVAVPFRELLLTAKVAGPIEFKSAKCKAGRFVKKGTLLMEIDPRDFRLEVERLTREFRQAEGLIAEADVEIANTKELVKLSNDDLELRRKELARPSGCSGETWGRIPKSTMPNAMNCNRETATSRSPTKSGYWSQNANAWCMPRNWCNRKSTKPNSTWTARKSRRKPMAWL